MEGKQYKYVMRTIEFGGDGGGGGKTIEKWNGGGKLIAALPRARSARGTEPHTRGIWSSSFRLVVT